MKCLIATEEGVREIIKARLGEKYSDWQFDTAGEEFLEPNIVSKQYDILVLSRFLCNKNPMEFLNDVVTRYMFSQIILLVGGISEYQKSFITAAKEFGLENIVYGKLPGERPNTIFAAFEKAVLEVQETLEPDDDSAGLVWEEETEEEVSEKETPGILQSPGGLLPDALPVQNTEAISVSKEYVPEKKDVIKSKLEEILLMLDGTVEIGNASDAVFIRDVSQQNKSALIVCAANKGGVGKTTVSVTLALALARAGIPTCLVDFDIGSPDVAPLLGITEAGGITAVADKPVTMNLLRDAMVDIRGLAVLPGPMTPVIPKFLPGQPLEIVKTLQQMYSVVVCDTPPEFWTRPWLEDIFAAADYVFAITDQSVIAEENTRTYAPLLLRMGVKPDKIGIVVNRYSPKLHNVKKIEQIFCSGFKKQVKPLPKVVAVIPENWTENVSAGYRNEVAGLDSVQSAYHELAKIAASLAGYEYKPEDGEKKKKKGLSGLFKR